MLRNKADVYKQNFGHVFVLAGSAPMLGASALVALAAMRTGAGLVTCGVPERLNAALQKRISPVIMTLPLPQTQGAFAYRSIATIKKLFSKMDVFAIGPGIGDSAGTRRLVLDLVRQCPKPLVLDAGGLNALEGKAQLLLEAKAVKVLTPHIKEMARLTGYGLAKIINNREKIAAAFAQKYHCVLLLKGNRTLIASPEGKVFVNRTGNAGMATAGSGDVLTGIIAALLGQGVEALEAATFGAYMHGKAGDLAAAQTSKFGMIATDIIEQIPHV